MAVAGLITICKSDSLISSKLSFLLINKQEYRQLKYNITCPSKNPKNSYDKLDLTNTKKYYKIGGF